LWLSLWLVPVILVVLTRGPDHTFGAIGAFFSKMAVVTFGGAYAVLAYMAQQAVDTEGKAEHDRVGHRFLSIRCCPQWIEQIEIEPEDTCPLGKSDGLAAPEPLVGFAECFLPRHADIPKQMAVVGFGDLAQCSPLARARGAAADHLTQAADDAPQALAGAVRDASYVVAESRRWPIFKRDGHGKRSRLNAKSGPNPTGRSRINWNKGRAPTKHRFSGVPEFFSLRSC
jgi:hypothetical protein